MAEVVDFESVVLKTEAKVELGMYKVLIPDLGRVGGGGINLMILWYALI